MKRGYVLPIFVVALSLGCGTQSFDVSRISDDQVTVNDLPTPILECVETQNGAVLADGRVELTVAKDQFHQLSAEIVQRDQFAGDVVLGRFLSVEEIDPRATFPAGLPNVPDLVYFGSEAQTTVRMTLSLWHLASGSGKFEGTLRLDVQTPYSQRSVPLSCEK